MREDSPLTPSLRTKAIWLPSGENVTRLSTWSTSLRGVPPQHGNLVKGFVGGIHSFEIINEAPVRGEFWDEHGARGRREKLNAIGRGQLAKPEAFLSIVVLAIGDIAAIERDCRRNGLAGRGDSLHADGREISARPAARPEVKGRCELSGHNQDRDRDARVFYAQ